MARVRIAITGGSGFIGTNLIEAALADGDETCSMDVREPRLTAHRSRFDLVDVLDAHSVISWLDRLQPDAVVHLAARTDVDSDRVDDYRVNYDGTRHILEAAAKVASVKRVVHTSTQFVYTLGRTPAGDEDFQPFTAYGESKVRSELVLRDRSWPFTWTIVRPTNVWGPWHDRYAREFWRVVERGLYFHPDGPPVRRAYGYVQTVCAQILCMLRAPEDRVDQRVFYVGDEAIPLDEWVDAFHVALKGRRARRVPLPVLRSIARAGDALAAVGLKAPLTTGRLRNMTEEHVAPMQSTFDLCGQPSITLDDGVARTVEWLRSSKKG